MKLESTAAVTKQQQLQQFFLNNYSEISSSIYESNPQLLVADHDRVLGLLANKFAGYRGALTDEAFLKWATKFVRREANRYRIADEIIEQCTPIIHAAICDGLRDSIARDESVEHEDIFAEVRYLIFKLAYPLMKPGLAKLSTRVYALTKRHVWFYYTSKWNRRHRLTRELIESGERFNLSDRDIVSDEQLAHDKREGAKRDAAMAAAK